MRRVVVESPYAGNVEKNLSYARDAIRDCLDRGEAPIASHLLYTQPGILDDNEPTQRRLGIDAGFAWWEVAHKVVFYADLGWSKGMLDAMVKAVSENIPYEVRSIRKDNGNGKVVPGQD